jgi:MFS family permease
VQFTFSAFIAFFLMLGMFFLKVPFLILMGLGLSAIFFVSVLGHRLRIDKIGFMVLINFAYWLCSAFLLGSISPLDLASPSFYDGDGRIFLSYIPLLLFSVVTVHTGDLRTSIRLVTWLGVGTLVLFAIWMMTHVPILSRGPKLFIGLMTSHTGAGTLFGFVTVFLILYGYEARKRSYMWLGIIGILPLVASASREALVGLFTVMGWYILRNRSLKVIYTFVIIAAICAVFGPVVAPHSAAKFNRLFSWELLENMKDTFEKADWEPGLEREEEVLGKEYNILSRMLFWQYAIKRFKESPAIGIGFGRYNDSNLVLSGIPGFVYVAYGGKKRFSGQAHNSYLHTLCESGAVGLGLLIWMWAAIYSRLKKATARFRGFSDLKAFYTACQGLVIFSLMSAFYGHALASPSICIPVLTVVGMGLAYHRTFEKVIRQNEDQLSPLPAGVHKDAP